MQGENKKKSNSSLTTFDALNSLKDKRGYPSKINKRGSWMPLNLYIRREEIKR